MPKLKLHLEKTEPVGELPEVLKFPAGGVFAVAGSRVDAQVSDALEVARSLERTLDDIQRQLDVLHEQIAEDEPYHLPGFFDNDPPAAA